MPPGARVKDGRGNTTPEGLEISPGRRTGAGARILDGRDEVKGKRAAGWRLSDALFSCFLRNLDVVEEEVGIHRFDVRDVFPEDDGEVFLQFGDVRLKSPKPQPGCRGLTEDLGLSVL